MIAARIEGSNSKVQWTELKHGEMKIAAFHDALIQISVFVHRWIG